MTFENYCSPPEAPVFYPTCDEFADPLEYIEKIRPIASRAGLCKIIPPKEWQPPFCVNVDEFRFTPRIQRINELEAGTRAKIKFYERLTKLYDSQGVKLKIPTVEKEILDLARLHKIVKDEGGYHICCSQKKWATVTRKMNFNDTQTSRVLKQHYEKLLLSYDVYETGIYEEQTDLSNQNDSKKGKVESNGTMKNGNKRKDSSSSMNNIDPFANFVCKCCTRGDDDNYLLICDICDNCYHTYCLIPSLVEIPRGQWRCPKCVAQLYHTASPSDAYGFEQSGKEYTLGEFGEMADEFKRNYFNKPLSEITADDIEQEFWRILSLPDASVKVEYGADLPTGELGSGFPTLKTKDLTENDKKYLNSPWNLNNFACHYKSVLKYINADISGMKVPWAYVGMCFSCFCWHVEDHWSYSINYLHWGEPKTWYGVPGSSAEKLENCMKSYAPELFSKTPDLLHHLVTTMNPSILIREGVPVVKAQQQAGEFIVTFPRAYHAGFNHGFNFAEANNFCPADWLPMGRCAIDHYKEVKRYSVFSHDELICKLASECQYLDPAIGDATRFELDCILQQEKNSRKSAYEQGAEDGDRVCFELMPDDERQCDACKTTCFLSAVSCLCKPNILVCINHIDQLCSCAPRKYCLWYRYTLNEMSDMLNALRERLDLCHKWKGLVNRLISTDHQSLIEFNDIEKHTSSGVLCLRDDIRVKMEEKLIEANECRQMAKNILKRVAYKTESLENSTDEDIIKKKKSSDNNNESKITLNDINQLKTRIKSIGITFNEMNAIQSILSDCLRFQDDIKLLLQSEKLQSTDIYSKYIEQSEQYQIDLPVIERLKLFYQASIWYELVQKTLTRTIPPSKLRSLITSGQAFQVLHQQVQQQINDLQVQLQQLEFWDEKCRQLTKEEPRPTLDTLEKFVKSADEANIHLNSIDKIKTLIIDCHRWNEKFEQMQQGEHYPFLSSYEQLYEQARHFHIDLEPLKLIEQTISQARSWLDKTQAIFRRPDSTLTLIEMILPRISVTPKTITRKRQTSKRTTGDVPINESIGILDDTIAKVLSSDENDPETVYKVYKEATIKEIEYLNELRETNQKKRLDSLSTYCICEKPYSDVMLQCDLCNEYYHRHCLPYHGSDVSTSVWWICDFCIRSRRPRLHDVVKLLGNLQKLTVRLPEGEILQCLTERAITLQDKAEKFLASPILRELSTVKQENRNIKDEFINDPNRQQFRNLESETSRPLNNSAESELESLLIEGGLLEIYVDQIKLLTKLVNSSRRSNLSLDKPKVTRVPQTEKTKSTTIRKRKSFEILTKTEKTIRRKRSRKSFLPDQRSSESQIGSSAPVVFVSSMIDIQQTLIKSSPKSDIDHDNNPLLISDDDNEQTKKVTIMGGGEDECAVDNGACLKPSGSSIKWVCCDACERWFHLVCVGLTSVKKKEEFKCTRCKQSASIPTVSSSISTPTIPLTS
ncbi:unnamed protein product [Adineta steineri]|uniref:[histone H3]-trimethyl-L-lysine(4) demethylase n=1 Tax=Adineta steineri TaxID=433720 RepID=A0A818IGZ0_9BILA|nr:unnamed protein product [Adineta steineri]CAF3525258.1 unnamed protein product [Adineta steineri]